MLVVDTKRIITSVEVFAMTQTQVLQTCVDMLAGYVPALAGAKVICFVHQYEIWSDESHSLFLGSYPSALLWLGCAAFTKQVCPQIVYYPPQVVAHVLRSGELAGVL
jgi:hypothetical protein